MRLSGTVTVNGVRVALDWTIFGNRIEAGPGLPCDNVRLHIPMADLGNSSGNILPLEETAVLDVEQPDEGPYSQSNVTCHMNIDRLSNLVRNKNEHYIDIVNDTKLLSSPHDECMSFDLLTTQ